MIEVQQTCCVCGITHCLPEGFYNDRKIDGQSWFCPNGHKLHVGKAVVPELKQQISQLQSQLDAQTSFWMQRIADELKENRTLKSMINILVAVCPFCKKENRNMSRHLLTKHLKALKDKGIAV